MSALRGAARRVRAAGRRASGALLEAAVAGAARLRPAAAPPGEPHSILVLRPNDLGDLLVVTPLFDALRRRFPAARITAAVGSWSAGLLAGNPHLSEVIAVDAPWFNKFVRRQGALASARFLAASPAVRRLRREGFEVGIDVLGSAWGALLLLRAGIPWRLGVQGYAGGHLGVQRRVAFDPWEHVGRRALRFAELLGATDLPPCRPQLFLSPAERIAGERCWGPRYPRRGERQPRRVAVAPGGGLAAKRWPEASWAVLVERLGRRQDVEIALVGGPGEREIGERLAALAPRARSFAGHLSLRESCALLAAADLLAGGSSVWMHAAAAFGLPTVALLGESFASAKQHDAQWGYPGTCWSLGKEEGGRTALATPDEALAKIDELLGAAAAGAAGEAA